MSKVNVAIRILLGVMLLVFGLNKFIGFMPMPEPPEAAANFMGAMVKTGYFMQFVGIVEVVAGVLLLIKKYVPLALVSVLPISINAFLFHAFLDPAGIGGAVLLTAMNIYLMYAYKDAYKDLLKA